MDEAGDMTTGRERETEVVVICFLFFLNVLCFSHRRDPGHLHPLSWRRAQTAPGRSAVIGPNQAAHTHTHTRSVSLSLSLGECRGRVRCSCSLCALDAQLPAADKRLFEP